MHVQRHTGVKNLGASSLGMHTVPWAYLFPIHFNVSHIVFEHGGHIHFWKLVFAENYEKAGLSTSSIPNNHKLFTNGSHLKRHRNR